ncbi:ead/Ea22-like family protein [Escherichia albertii]
MTARFFIQRLEQSGISEQRRQPVSKIDYQALREAAQNAKDLGGIKNYKRGEQAVAEFESLITPHIVLALLDERESNEVREVGNQFLVVRHPGKLLSSSTALVTWKSFCGS